MGGNLCPTGKGASDELEGSQPLLAPLGTLPLGMASHSGSGPLSMRLLGSRPGTPFSILDKAMGHWPRLPTYGGRDGLPVF